MSFKQINKNNKGFTIIEVLIVLAIAGLIMLVVFLAVPALQRSQRNNARKSEASRLAAVINDCLANKNGDATQCDSPDEIGFTLAAGIGALPITEYNELKTVKASATASDASTTQAIYQLSAQCGTGAFTTGSNRQYAVGYKYESGSNQVWACING